MIEELLELIDDERGLTNALFWGGAAAGFSTGAIVQYGFTYKLLNAGIAFTAGMVGFSLVFSMLTDLAVNDEEVYKALGLTHHSDEHVELEVTKGESTGYGDMYKRFKQE